MFLKKLNSLPPFPVLSPRHAPSHSLPVNKAAAVCLTDSGVLAHFLRSPRCLWTMAHAGVVLDKDQFNCSICLDVLRDPVTIPCGHSYCSDCIKNYWDQDDYLGVYVCPQCRQNFNPRPVLARNTMLADVVEKFKKTGLQEAGAPSKQSFAEAEDVECDVCTGRKNKAVKSCLVCLASYCELHVQPHYESTAFKKHRLVSASKKFRETICGRHDKLLEVYCRTDRQCICYLCLTDEHKGHDTVLAEEEMQQKQVITSSD